MTPLAGREGGPVQVFRTTRNCGGRFSVRHRQRVEKPEQIFPQNNSSLAKLSGRKLPGCEGLVELGTPTTTDVAGFRNTEPDLLSRVTIVDPLSRAPVFTSVHESGSFFSALSALPDGTLK
jgi:hypothetical protein